MAVHNHIIAAESNKYTMQISGAERLNLWKGTLYTSQILELDGGERKWVVDKILTHAESKKNAIFEVLWKTGDRSWLPYQQISNLQVLEDYLEAYEAESILGLGKGSGSAPKDDPQVFLGHTQICSMDKLRSHPVPPLKMAPKCSTIQASTPDAMDEDTQALDNNIVAPTPILAGTTDSVIPASTL
ncbi:hypothetical protein C0992_011009 [Termitomyces sp. T32_za158]|nr:hypothetical protein C0992_011009 [Termitomyces sp. T32_za158]